MFITRKLKFLRGFVRRVAAFFGNAHLENENGNTCNNVQTSENDLNDDSSKAVKSKVNFQSNQNVNKRTSTENDHHSVAASKHQGKSIRKTRRKILRRQLRNKMGNKIRKSGGSECSGDGEDIVIEKSKLLKSAVTSCSPSKTSDNMSTVSRYKKREVKKRPSDISSENPNIKTFSANSKTPATCQEERYLSAIRTHPLTHFYDRNIKEKFTCNIMRPLKSMTSKKRATHHNLQSIRKNSASKDPIKRHHLREKIPLFESGKKDKEHVETSKTKKKIPKYQLTIKTKDKKGRRDAEYQIVIKPNRVVDKNMHYQFYIKSNDRTRNKDSEYRIVINGNDQLRNKLIKNNDGNSKTSTSVIEDHGDEEKHKKTCDHEKRGYEDASNGKHGNRQRTSVCQYCHSGWDGEHNDYQNACSYEHSSRVHCNPEYYEEDWEYDYEN